MATAIIEYYVTKTSGLGNAHEGGPGGGGTYATSVGEAAKEYALFTGVDVNRVLISVAEAAVIEAADEEDTAANEGLDEQDHEFRDYETFCGDFVTTLGGFVEGDRVMGGDTPEDFDVGTVTAIGPGGITVAFELTNQCIEVPAEGMMPADQEREDHMVARLGDGHECSNLVSCPCDGDLAR